MADYYNNSAANNGCFDWDDEIQNDGQEFITLPEGDYVFEVVDFERGRYPGSAKIPPCNKASLTLQVKTEDGIARIRTDLILYRSLEWKISSFFRSVSSVFSVFFNFGSRWLSLMHFAAKSWSSVPFAEARYDM